MATAGGNCRLQAARLSCCNRWTEAAQVGTFTCKFEICEPKFRKTEPNGVNLYTVRDDITRQDSIRPGEHPTGGCYFISHSKPLIYTVSLKFAVPNNTFYLHPPANSIEQRALKLWLIYRKIYNHTKRFDKIMNI